MAIRFPKLHIAESVVNRILNVNDGLVATRPQPAPAPAAPDPELVAFQDMALTSKLMQPLSGPLPGIEQAPEAATGKPMLDTLISQ